MWLSAPACHAQMTAMSLVLLANMMPDDDLAE